MDKKKNNKKVDITKDIKALLIILDVGLAVIGVLSLFNLIVGTSNTIQTTIEDAAENIGDSYLGMDDETAQVMHFLNKIGTYNFNGFGSASAQADAEVYLNFQSHFETREVRSLEKDDLTCVDEYTYGSFVPKVNPILAQALDDKRCSIFKTLNEN